MKLAHRLLVALAAWCLLMPAVLLAQSPQGEPLRVGSKRFTESYILAEIVAQTALQAGVPPTAPGTGQYRHRPWRAALGPDRCLCRVHGHDCTGNRQDATQTTLEGLNRALASQGLAVGVPLGFNNGYALAMRRDVAQRLGITRLSDLARHPELRYGLSNEFLGRADGWAGLAQRYDLKAQPQGLDHGLAYEAIRQQHIDVMDIYTTDAKIDHLGLLVLQDDKAISRITTPCCSTAATCPSASPLPGPRCNRCEAVLTRRP